MNCPDNCGCEAIMKRNKEDVQVLFKGFNCIKNWVIVGMATLVINLGLTVLKLFIMN